MITQTPELDLWRGGLGVEYTLSSFAKTPGRETLFREILTDHYDSILEVGCNVGNNLDDLKFTGAKLYGIDPCFAALKSHKLSLRKSLIEYGYQAFVRTNAEMEYLKKLEPPKHQFNRIQGTGFGLPFENQTFDLVLAAGVLCHISPKDISVAIDELFRVGKQVLIVDYYSVDDQPMKFRYTEALWSRNFYGLVRRQPELAAIVYGFDRTREMRLGLWKGR